jgi:methyl-accepting chemotaxis protein
MQVVRDLSVSKKLYGSFGLVLVLLIAVVGGAFVGMGNLGSAEHQIAGPANASVAAADEVRYAAADLNGWQTAYVLDRGKSHGAFVTSDQYFQKALATLRRASAGNAAEAALADTVASTYDRFNTLDAGVWGAIQKRDFAKAQQIALGPEIAAYNALAAAASAVARGANGRQAAADTSFATTSSSTGVMLTVIAAIAVAIAAALAWVLARAISRPLAKVQRRRRQPPQAT